MRARQIDITPFGQNIITVGVGGDFRDVSTALAAITDNSVDNPYHLKLLPGDHGHFTMKPYIQIDGTGKDNTFIETSWGSVIYMASNSGISNASILFSGNSGGATVGGALRRSSSIDAFVLRDIKFDIYGLAGAGAARYAVYEGTGTVKMDCYNVHVKTESGGFACGYGEKRFHDCDVFLVGANVGLPHIGLHDLVGTRIDWYGGRICTGYQYANPTGCEDEDIICVYIAADAVGPSRTHLYNATLFARNVDANLGVKVNCIRAENGWVRAFGCMGQTELETNANSNTSKAVHAVYRTADEPATGQGGKIEAFGCRFSNASGNIQGGLMHNISRLDNSHDGEILTHPGEGGLYLCDATAGAFTLQPNSNVNCPYGEEYAFKKVDASANAVTITPTNGKTIDGAASVVLSSQYDSTRIVWDAVSDAWFKI